MNDQTLPILLGMSGALTAVVDMAKPYLAPLKEKDENLYVIAVHIVRFLAALVAVVSTGITANILAGVTAFQDLPYTALVLITALGLTLGSDFLNGFRDLLYSGKLPTQEGGVSVVIPPASPDATGTTSTTVSATVESTGSTVPVVQSVKY